MSNALNHGRFGARPRKEAVVSSVDPVLCIEIAPLTRSEEISSRSFDGFILCSTDTSLPVRCDPTPMQSTFGLTPAEMAIVNSIGQGLTNPEIAERRERSVATVNTQVKSILSKIAMRKPNPIRADDATVWSEFFLSRSGS